MNVVIAVIAALPSAVVLAHGAWWSLLSVVALPRPRPSLPATRSWRLAVVVPAHNEELLLGACLDSLLAAPCEPRPEVVAVADNCDDATAAVAQSRGVTVLERRSASLFGKSYALDHALAYLRAQPRPPEAVVFVDADTVVSPELFASVASALDGGARAAQVHYAPAAARGELAALRRLALSLAHWSRPLGASRLGLGSGLKGNGMALRWELVRDGFGSSGITEDAALTVQLAGRGVPVQFVPGATVWGYMGGSYTTAAVQDRRWEAGRMALLPRAAFAAIYTVLRRRPAAAGGALEVASLPLTLLAALAAAALFLAAIEMTPQWLAAAAAVSLVASTVIGLAAARTPLRDLAALRGVPRFLVHKAGVYASIVTRRPATWQRTARE